MTKAVLQELFDVVDGDSEFYPHESSNSFFFSFQKFYFSGPMKTMEFPIFNIEFNYISFLKPCKDLCQVHSILFTNCFSNNYNPDPPRKQHRTQNVGRNLLSIYFDIQYFCDEVRRIKTIKKILR